MPWATFCLEAPLVPSLGPFLHLRGLTTLVSGSPSLVCYGLSMSSACPTFDTVSIDMGFSGSCASHSSTAVWHIIMEPEHLHSQAKDRPVPFPVYFKPRSQSRLAVIMREWQDCEKDIARLLPSARP